jgi:glycosyltransferase involved in cell wall biosynthesis
VSVKIAMYGLKGIPYTAGVEIVVEELGSRLASRGHEVVVYVRPQYTDTNQKTYRGMRLVCLPSIPTKNLDAITHSFLAAFVSLLEKPDIVHIHSTGNSIFAFLPRLFNIPSLVQSHGLDWQRAKWGRFARTYLKLTDFTTTYFPTVTTAVSEKLQHYYMSKFKRPVIYIPNGVAPIKKVPPREIQKYGLKGNDYIFFASRLVPEKGCHYLIEAYQMLAQTDKKLVIAGDAWAKDPYAVALKKNAGERILFLGFVQGNLLAELLSNAYLYVLPSEVEGLSMGLLEAMNYGNCALVSDIEENLEVLGDAGETFKSGSSKDLALKLKLLLDDEEKVNQYRYLAQNTFNQEYDWEKVTDCYEKLYQSLIKKKAYNLAVKQSPDVRGLEG